MIKIKRRAFLILSSVWGISLYAQGKKYNFERALKEVDPLIFAVQNHMFPEKSKIPSAEAMHASQFLYATLVHPSFDKDIRNFVIEGARELQSRTKYKFIRMSIEEKEHALREYESTEYGSSWLSRIMILTIEGVLGDPIYGSNIKKLGWKALDVHGGYPRPKSRYLEDV